MIVKFKNSHRNSGEPKYNLTRCPSLGCCTSSSDFHFLVFFKDEREQSDIFLGGRNIDIKLDSLKLTVRFAP